MLQNPALDNAACIAVAPCEDCISRKVLASGKVSHTEHAALPAAARVIAPARQPPAALPTAPQPINRAAPHHMHGTDSLLCHTLKPLVCTERILEWQNDIWQSCSCRLPSLHSTPAPQHTTDKQWMIGPHFRL
jgi:hypothetical protein